MSTTHRGTPVATAPELSVVLSSYNQAEILEPAIRQCLRVIGHSVAHYELIVLNDGSNDGSVRILDRLRKEFSHLRVIHQLRMGRPRALRRGFDLARAPYVFQFDIRSADWLAAFPRFWELRQRYALIQGYHGDRGGRLQRSLRWVLHRWIKLFFGAELVEPDSDFRLSRRDWAIDCFNRLPKDYEGVNLVMTLATFRDSPRSLIELEVGQGTPPRHAPLSEQATRLSHLFWETASMRWKKMSFPGLTPAPQTP